MADRDPAPGAGTPLTILGGGPAGLAVAHYAHASGVPFVLFEKSAELGGLCRTLACDGHRYDTGAHRFHDRDPEITRDVRDLLGDDLLAVDAPSQILHRGRFIDFPPRPLAWLRGHGLLEGARVAGEVLAARLRPRPERSFEDLVANRYGLRLGRPLLLDYSEKLWGVPARELEPDVATRRLAGLTIPALLFEVFRPRTRTGHLDGAFLYPRRGYGAIVDAMAARLPAASLRTGHEVTALECQAARVTRLHFKHGPHVETSGPVVSTLPLSLLARMLGEALPEEARRAAAALRFRHLRLVFLRLALPSASGNATVYLPESRFAVSRVTEPRNRSAALAPAGETALVAEVPCSDGEALFSLEPEALARRVIDELAEARLLSPGSVLEWRHHFLANAYPVYALGYRQRVEEVRQALARIQGLHLLGRGGRFLYSHLHDQMRAAKDYVRSLASS